MAKHRRRAPARIACHAPCPPGRKKSDLIQVVIETPKGSRNKYAFASR